MRRTRISLAAACLAALLGLACDAPDEPNPAPGPDPAGEPGGDPTGGEGGGGDPGTGGEPGTGGDAGGGAGGGGGGGTGGGGNGTDTVSTLVLAFEPDGEMRGATRLDLDLVAIGLYVDRSAPAVGDRTDCGAGGALVDAQSTVTLDLAGDDDDERVPFASIDLADGEALHEVWLVLRQGILHKDGRTYKVHADLLCTMPDGLRYTLLRVRPGSPVPLGGEDHLLVLPFDPDDRIDEERIDCRVRPEEECETSDDPADDDDPQTRLRYTFEPEQPVRAEPLPR